MFHDEGTRDKAAEEVSFRARPSAGRQQVGDLGDHNIGNNERLTDRLEPGDTGLMIRIVDQAGGCERPGVDDDGESAESLRFEALFGLPDREPRLRLTYADEAKASTSLVNRRDVLLKHLGGNILGRGAPIGALGGQALRELVRNNDSQLGHEPMLRRSATQPALRRTDLRGSDTFYPANIPRAPSIRAVH